VAGEQGEWRVTDGLDGNPTGGTMGFASISPGHAGLLGNTLIEHGSDHVLF
jgi:hypothetical protein